MPNHFQFDVILSHSAKDKPVVRPQAVRLRQDGPTAKAEGRLQKAEILHSSFFIHPLLCAFGSAWAQLQFPQPSTSQRPAEQGVPLHSPAAR